MNNTAKEPHGIVERPPVMRRSFRWLTAIGFIGLGCILLATGIDVGLLRARLESLGPWAPIAFVVISVLLMSTLLPKTIVSVTAGVMFVFK